MDQPLTDRIAEALRTAAYDCDGTCGLTEPECVQQHPIQVEVHHHNQVAGVYGYITALADVAAAVVEPELAARDAEIAKLRAERDQFADRLNKAINRNRRLRAALATDHHIAYHQGEPSDGLLHHCGRDHCTAPASCPAD